MEISKLLEDLFDEKTVSELSSQHNLNPKQVTEVAQLGLPAILSKLNVNSKDKQGQASLSKALDDHQQDDVSDVLGFLKSVDRDDSKKMLGHIMGGESDQVSQFISEKSGVSKSDVMSMLVMLAPLIMGFLGNKKQEVKKESKSDGFDLGDLIGGITKQAKKSSKTDGSLFDSVTDLIGGNAGGLTDLIGGFFNKK